MVPLESPLRVTMLNILSCSTLNVLYTDNFLNCLHGIIPQVTFAEKSQKILRFSREKEGDPYSVKFLDGTIVN